MIREAITYEEYRAKYEAIERAATAGAMTWKVACAKIALLSIEYGYQSCCKDNDIPIDD